MSSWLYADALSPHGKLLIVMEEQRYHWIALYRTVPIVIRIWTCHPFYGVAIVRSLQLLFFDDMEGNVKIFIAIKSSSAGLRHRHRTVDRCSISV